MPVSKSTANMLPQSTEALRVSKNYSEMAYLKLSKCRILSFFFSIFSFFFSQPNALTQEVTQVKIAIGREELPQGSGTRVVLLNLALSETTIYTECLQ